jgi:hypothetical protein
MSNTRRPARLRLAAKLMLVLVLPTLLLVDDCQYSRHQWSLAVDEEARDAEPLSIRVPPTADSF